VRAPLQRGSSPPDGRGSEPLSDPQSGRRAALANVDVGAAGSTNGPGRPADPPFVKHVAAKQPANPPGVAGRAPVFGNSETLRWVRRSVAVAVPILALNTIFTAFADNMPLFHHTAALIAAPVFAAAWIIELSGVRWPRLLLIAAMVVPNLWLTLIGNTETNLLFLPLLVA
jgi:hypothetical protein